MESYCVVPWTHLYIDELGFFYPCCFCDKSLGPLRDVNGQPIRASSDHFCSALNSAPALKKMRLEMLTGKFPAYCKDCWQKEKVQVESNRMHSNEKIATAKEQLAARTEKDGTTEMQLVSLDLRLGNRCNLACRMCSPYSSDQLIDIYHAIYGDSLELYRNINWFEPQIFWDQLLEKTANLRFLHLAGGEPLILKKSFDFLQMLIEQGGALNICLSYNTNLSVLPQEIYNYWPNFKSVDLSISLDGVGKVNEYIRYPLRWDIFHKNLWQVEKDFQRLNICAATIHSVFQAYNLMDVVNICHFTQQFKNISNYPLFDFIFGEQALGVEALPKELRQAVMPVIEQLKRELAIRNDSSARRANLISQLTHLQNKISAADRPELTKRLWEISRIFDQQRGQNLREIIPLFPDFD